jgi:hypothetical protein
VISFNLRCAGDHAFEGWFANSEDFEKQRGLGLVECPYCGDQSVEKALMAPAVSTSRRKEKAVSVMMDAQKDEALAQLRDLVRKVRENAEDVGERFAEEARRIHFGETEPRGIYGTATPVEVKSLADEGVDFLPLPRLPEDQN